MLSGKVVGNVWSSTKIDSMPSGTLVEIKLDNSGDYLVAFDPLSCGEGEKVLIATGSAAANHLGSHTPIDALVIASLEETS
ncbi:MAG: ethanolamine utilization protein EutN [Shimia sp.]|nr:ethanolamine utilization protein EutN [Shimia sp.]